MRHPPTASGTESRAIRALARPRWNVLAPLALVVVFFAVNRDFLLGRAFPIHDADGFFAPFFMYVAELARHGELLTWNPFNNGGSPDFADPQVGAFCPIILSFGLVFGDTLLAYIAYFLSIWALGALFMFALSRRLGAPRFAAFSIALAFVFCGYFVGHGQHVSFVRSFAFLPGIIWRLDVGLCSRRWRPFAEAGLFWGLCALGGYPAVTILNTVAALGWIGLHAIFGPVSPNSPTQAPRTFRFHRDTFVRLCLLGATGIFMTAGTYAAFFLAANDYSSRVGGLPREIAVGSGALHPRGLATMASPWLATAPTNINWDYTYISSVSIYIGALVVILGFAAPLLQPKQGWRWGLLVFVILSVATALGVALPLRGWLFDWLPPFRYFRHAAVARGQALFFLATLASLAAGNLSRWRDTRDGIDWTQFAIVAAISISTFAAVHFGFSVVEMPPNHPMSRLATSHVNVIWIATPIVLLIWSLGSRHKKVMAAVAISIVALAIYDAHYCYHVGLTTLRHESPAIAAQWKSIEERRLRVRDGVAAHGLARDRVSNDNIGLGPGLTSKNLLLRVPVLYGYSALTSPYHLFLKDEPTLSTTAIGLRPDRIWFSPHLYHTTYSMFQRHQNAAIKNGGKISLIAEDPSIKNYAKGDLESSIPAERIEVQLKSYRSKRLRFDVDVPGDGWLLITDRFAPYWTATVNGVETPVIKGNYIFRLLQVKAGHNEVDMRYHPRAFVVLAILGWMIALGVGIWSATALLQRLRTRNQEIHRA